MIDGNWKSCRRKQNSWQSVISADTLEQVVLKAIESPGSCFLDNKPLAGHIGKTIREWLGLGGNLEQRRAVRVRSVFRQRGKKREATPKFVACCIHGVQGKLRI